jgi:hypothetical protein
VLTQPAPVKQAPEPEHPRGMATTPVRLRAFAAGVVALAALVAALLVMAVGDIGGGYQSIGHRSAPQVVATADLYFALNDMDAQLANALLVGDDQHLGIKRADTLTVFDQRRTQADQDLQQAAAAAGDDAAAQKALKSVLDALGSYQELAAQTILVDGRAHHAAGKPPADVLGLYRQATDQLKNNVLPAVKSLTDANTAALNKTYKDQRSSIDQDQLLLFLACAALLASLVGLQIYLNRRFRRRFNPALAAATAATLVFFFVGSAKFSNEAHDLKVAKEDAFDSILALGKARATSYDANADESRFLVDPQRADQYAQSYLDKSQAIATMPGATLVSYSDKLDQTVAGAGGQNAQRFHGYLGDELANVTFPGEQGAALDTLRRYQTYEHDDHRIRALAQAGKLRDAIEFDTGTATNQSNADFTAYDQALVGVIKINQRYFDQSIKQGQDGLSGWTVIPPVVLLIIAGLAVGGVAPRLAEYR